MYELFERKDEHIKIAVEENVELLGESLLDDVYLIHYACSEVSPSEVDLFASFLGRCFKAPIVIEALTGGTPLGKKINEILAEVAEEYDIPIGVGSQRIAVEKRELEDSFRVVREKASSAFVIANIGAAQLAGKKGLEYALRAVEMLDADALAVHLNLLHELIQVEGDSSFKGLLSKIKVLSRELGVPIIAKEVGYGISKEAALALSEAGVSAIDVAGKGGTCWNIIESIRAEKRGNELKKRLAECFKKWGIPTAISILEVRSVLPKIPLIGSGGIRSGLDIAKVLVLGANLAGIALPFLRHAYRGGIEAVRNYLDGLLLELKIAVALTGCSSIKEFKEKKPYVVSNRILSWLEQRGISL